MLKSGICITKEKPTVRVYTTKFYQDFFFLKLEGNYKIYLEIKRFGIARIILKKIGKATLPDLKVYYQDIVIKIVGYWNKDIYRTN